MVRGTLTMLCLQGKRTACHAATMIRHVSNATPQKKPVVSLFYNDIYHVTLPPNHRFPMEKYRLVRETLQKEFSPCDVVEFHPSPEATFEELSSSHCPEYIRRYLSGQLTELEIRRTGFPWSIEHVRRSTSSVGGTVAAMRAVLHNPHALISGHIAGGTHHAFYNYGEGFCIFSDIAVAANLALKEFPEQVKQIVIIDLDVHQGNGNAVLFQNRKEVFTFSMHCKENYFSKVQASDVDVELEKGCTDEKYLAKLQAWLPYLFTNVNPDLVFFQAGVDISRQDKLGKLAITQNGIHQRNQMVFSYALNAGVKCVITMGGGYPKDLTPTSDPFQEVIQCHADVYRDGINAFRSYLEKKDR